MTEKAKILVLDDKMSWILTMRSLLEDEYEVVYTTSAAQARRKARRNRFDLVILDQRLPNNEKGVQVLSTLRRTAPTLPAIILTEYPSFQDMRESFHAGAVDYIPKNEKCFVEKLRASIKKHKNTTGTKVFISYQHEDKKAVEALYAKLMARGLLPWMDVKCAIRGKWLPQIQRAIIETDYFLCCFSNESLKHKQSVFRDELALALKIQKRLFRTEAFIVPIKLSPCEIPKEFEVFQSVNLSDKDGFARLMAMLT